MRTLILALAVVLLAAPAWADVKIIITDVTTDPAKPTAEISYDATTETELVRAFALNIWVDEGNIVDVCDYAVGDNNAGYGIFPGNFSRFITVNTTTGNVDNWGIAGYTPVADAGDPDALGGLDSNGVTIEMGALYDDAPPAKTGVLCRLVCSESCKMSAVGNAIRGNVVLEDAAEATTDESMATGVQIGGECFPSTNSTYDYWVAYGKPLCWCNSADGGTGDYQCDGDFNNDVQGLLKFRIYTNDLNRLIPHWKEKIGDVGVDPCSDCDHKPQGLLKFRVYTNDLQCLIDNWKAKDADLPGDCPRPE